MFEDMVNDPPISDIKLLCDIYQIKTSSNP